MSINQAPACPSGNLYTIRPGDTLYALAGRFNTTVVTILAANPGLSPNNLQIGQNICIPGVPGPVSCPGGTIYNVQPGDTLFLIAQRFGISVQTLIAANPGIDPRRLQIGQSICILLTITPTPCCRVLLPIQIFPLAQVPFTPAGTVLIQVVNPNNTAVTITESGLPEPNTFGQFDIYQSRIILPLSQTNPTPEIFSINLTSARAFEAPVVWVGSRVIPRVLVEGTTVIIIPFNTGTDRNGSPLLRSVVGPCR